MSSGGNESHVGAHCFTGVRIHLKLATEAMRLSARRYSRRIQTTCALLQSKPYIILWTLLVLVSLLAAGLASVLTASADSISKARDLALNGVGNSVALSIREALLKTAFGSELLGAYVTQTPFCETISAQWPAVSSDIFKRINNNIVRQLELDVAAVIWKTAPALEGELAKILYGKDLLQGDDRAGTVELMAKRNTTIMGPYKCTEGFDCMFTVTPIFLPAPDESYDWGCGRQPYNCTDLCWDPVNKTKYWGQVSTMINIDPLIENNDFQLRTVAGRGYNFRLWQESTAFYNPYFEIAATEKPPHEPTISRINAANLLWYLELAPAAGWVPSWRTPCLAVVVVGSFLVSLLVLWLLVSKEQHNTLLRAMLPPKVIKQLQDGETTVAQEFSGVSILFSDIVGYTTVASKLSPWQVVQLLNELFTLLDDLAHRNGVYKVETIGDALMCAAGCPVADDPVCNAVRMANMALDMISAVEQFRPSLEGVTVQIRVGIHSGPVVAGVVGKKMPRYCLFGDTVNTSSRMESTSQPMRIQVSEATAALLLASGEGYVLQPRGPVNVKGKGQMETFWLAGGPNDSAVDPASAQPPGTLVVMSPGADSFVSRLSSHQGVARRSLSYRGGGVRLAATATNLAGSPGGASGNSRIRRLTTILRLGRSLSGATLSGSSLHARDSEVPGGPGSPYGSVTAGQLRALGSGDQAATPARAAGALLEMAQAEDRAGAGVGTGVAAGAGVAATAVACFGSESYGSTSGAAGGRLAAMEERRLGPLGASAAAAAAVATAADLQAVGGLAPAGRARSAAQLERTAAGAASVPVAESSDMSAVLLRGQSDASCGDTLLAPTPLHPLSLSPPEGQRHQQGEQPVWSAPSTVRSHGVLRHWTAETRGTLADGGGPSPVTSRTNALTTHTTAAVATGSHSGVPHCGAELEGPLAAGGGVGGAAHLAVVGPGTRTGTSGGGDEIRGEGRGPLLIGGSV